MDLDWFPASIIIAVVFYVSYLVYNGIGLFDNSWMSTMFGSAFIMGALIVIVMLAKPLFFPRRDLPQQ